MVAGIKLFNHTFQISDTLLLNYPQVLSATEVYNLLYAVFLA